jgi:hypothetical protein
MQVRDLLIVWAAHGRPARKPHNSWMTVGQLPARIRHGRPRRLLIRAAAASLLSLGVLHLIPGQPAAPPWSPA